MTKIHYPTEHDDNAYNIKVIQCGDNLEIYQYGKAIKTNKISPLKGTKREKREISEDEKYINRLKVLNMNRNKIARLIKCNLDMQYFITLTFKDLPTISESKKMLNIAFTKIRKHVENFKYIWIMEFGEKKGRLHYHLLTNMPFDENIKFVDKSRRKSQEHKNLEYDFQEKYWNYGLVDIRKLDNTKNIVGYVCNYLIKSLVNKDLVNQQVFNHSRNINKPLIDTYMSCDNAEDILTTSNMYNLKFSSSYQYFDSSVNYFDFREKE